jgi:hypothetical protein
MTRPMCCLLLLFALSSLGCWAEGIRPTARGAVVETARYRTEIRDGVVTGIINVLTGESYLDADTDLRKVVPHLPSGLGTQAGERALAGAEKLYHWPWWEHPADTVWPNQHYPDAGSVVHFAARGETAGTLTYTGLTDGQSRFPDERFGVELAIEPGTGDLLLTPWGASPRQGVYAANLTVAPLASAVTAEAPIFDGVRLDRHMQPMLWTNAWGGYWDYAFLAFNGYKRGAVAIWTQDTELRYYKSLFFLINPEGLSFSFSTMNLPPFTHSTAAKSAIPWRLQAFDQSWGQAAARFRAWRAREVKGAPRPEWVDHLSYVSLISSGKKEGLDRLSAYFGHNKAHLSRVANFAAVVRKAAFDTKHYDNTPYDGFGEDMKLWQASGAHFMAYLQPMIMWGAPEQSNDLFWKRWEMHLDADTRSVFQPADTVVPLIDQHHLGHQAYQRWFLECVKSYIQDYGAAGVYHDQSYHCPIDSRGPLPKLGNMTSVQGMADYFRKAQTDNPNSVHGTEHMTEVNNVGASLGIAGGILWGTAPSMRMQRIRHASSVSAALAWPNGVLFSFPHYSDLTTRQNAQFFNWGQDLMERRAEIAGGYLPMEVAPESTATFRNHAWIEDQRVKLFVSRGLRPVFPETMDRQVRSYFTGANGEDFRYRQYPWGSALVESGRDGRETLHYGRIHGVSEAAVPGAVYGWLMYNQDGPAGLHPERYYPVDPQGARPAVYFSPANKFTPGLSEAYIEECAGNAQFAWMLLRPGPRGAITQVDEMLMHTPAKPALMLINGFDRTSGLQERGPGAWWVNFRVNDTLGTTSVVLLTQPAPAGFGQDFVEQLLCRSAIPGDSLDSIDTGVLARQLKIERPDAHTIKVTTPKRVSHLLFATRPPEPAGPGTMKVTYTHFKELYVNGKKSDGVIAFKTGDESVLVTLRGDADHFRATSVTVQWIPAVAPPATPAAPAAK